MGPFTKIAIGIVLGILVLSAVYYRFFRSNNTPSSNTSSTIQNTPDNTERFDGTSNTENNSESSHQQQEEALATPTDQFKTRITKKFFGTFVTPQNSPVKPERFTGYHTGVDVEFSDISEDVPVFAIADCNVVLSKTASGYGGVLVVQFQFQGTTYTALYGHIRPTTLPAVGARFTKNQQIAVLGSGFTSETDQERHHLHFGIRPGTSVDIRGYVQNQPELSGWVNPLTLYK